MSMHKQKSQDKKHRDEVLKRMLKTPPKPNKPLKETVSDKDQNDRDPDAK